MNKNVTLSVFIPAYNERDSITSTINGVLKQKQDTFALVEIVVACDGCTDGTELIVKRIMQKHPEVKLIDEGTRVGKAARIGEFFSKCTSDAILILDADILIKDTKAFEKLLAHLSSEVAVVAPYAIPAEPTSFIHEAIVTYERFWRKVTDRINHGNNIHNCLGCTLLIRRALFSQLVFPPKLVAEDHYIYLACKALKLKFKLAKNVKVEFNTPKTIKDYVAQNQRYQSGQEKIVALFDKYVGDEYEIPLKVKIRAYLRTYIEAPLHLPFALLLQIYLRAKPIKKINNPHLWQMVTSTKKPQKNLKVAFLDFDDISNPLLGAGQARATSQVGSLLVKKGYTVGVISSRFPGSKDRTENGITYKHIGLGSKSIKLNNLLYFFFLPFAVLKLKADLIVECFTAPISTGFSPLFTKIPVIALPSMFNAKAFAKKYFVPFHWIEALGLKFYKYILPYSQTDEAKAKKLNRKIKTKIVGQGVGSEFFNIPMREPKHILFFGRLDIHQKGIDLMLESLSLIRDALAYPVLIAGHGPDKSKVEKLIKLYKLESKVKLIGPIYKEAKADIFSKTAFALFPSRHDEICLGTLETLAAGIPLVAYDISESSWLTSDVCIKAKAFDTKEFSQNILKLTNTNLCWNMKQNARKLAGNYKWENVTNEFDAFFKEVLQMEVKRV